MKNSNTAIILILNDHMVPHRVTAGVIEVQCCDCVKGEKDSQAWIKVPDIISAQWVVGALA